MRGRCWPRGAAPTGGRCALGPALGQCCGGSVTLDFAAAERAWSAGAAGAPLWIWGAGHVGRALVRVLAPLPDWAITWVDTAPDRFPAPMRRRDAAASPPIRCASPRRAPERRDHLILTYSPRARPGALPCAPAARLRSCGLIGSATKWARFRTRLAALGHAHAQISRIACPIGDPGLGKHPQAIAVGVAAALLRSRGRA